MAIDEPASPACLAHEADDAYMGFATPAEVLRFRQELATACDGTKAEMLRKMLPKIRDGRLHAQFAGLLAEIMEIESKT